MEDLTNIYKIDNKMDCDGITSDIIAEIIENAYHAINASFVESSCQNGTDEVGEIITEILKLAYDAYAMKLTGEPEDANKESDEQIDKIGSRSESDSTIGCGAANNTIIDQAEDGADEVSKAIQIVELAYDACTAKPTVSEQKIDEQISKIQSTSGSESDLIVDCVDEIGTGNNAAEYESAMNTSAESHESIVVECIEICRNVSDEPFGMVQVKERREADLEQKPIEVSPKIKSDEPSSILQVNQKHGTDVDGQPIVTETLTRAFRMVQVKEGREADLEQKPIEVSPKIKSDEPSSMLQVNQKHGTGVDGQPIVTETLTRATEVCESPESDEFYSYHELHRRGYLTKFTGDMKCVTNMSLPADSVDLSTVHCRGFPPDMTDNQLIPMLEKFGRILELKSAANTNETIDVAFMTNREANSAVKGLNGRIIQGRRVQVEKFKRDLFVKSIPVKATKSELFDHFNRLTSGLIKLFLMYATDHATNNRGYCYLMYKDYECALAAKEIISKSNYGGRKLICEWTDRQDRFEMTREMKADSRPIRTTLSRKIYMKNLHPDLNSTDLRKMFSVFGEVVEVDKNGNWASVKYRHSSETNEAFLRVDRKRLGNDIIISLNEVME